MFDNLKAELHTLDCRILVERDEEVRHALQRSRLEAERAKKLVELMAAYAGVPEQLKPVVASGYKVSIQAVPQLEGPEPSGSNGSNGLNGVSKPASGSIVERCASSVNGALSNGGISPHKYGKPPGLPSVRAMVTAALEDAAEHGHNGLRPQAVLSFVREKWWPNAKASAICSVVWQMAQDGYLQHDGKLYKLNGHDHTTL